MSKKVTPFRPSGEEATGGPTAEATAQTPQTVQAMAIPPPLFQQVVKMISKNVCHDDADPILQQLLGCQMVNITLGDGGND